ncbi:MAG: baseplate J/gp47 family protein [Oscillospiraceae bacterium]
MIDEKILDEIFPVPELADLRDAKVAELKEAGFAITNFNSGGVFYFLLMIVLQMYIEIIEFFRSVLNNMFVSHAKGVWLKLKAGDFSKKQKAALKTHGDVTVSRTSAGEAITIEKGHVFKTAKDINGDTLRYFVTEDTVLQKDVLSTKVPVEAEIAGAKYNVAAGKITQSLTNIDGIDAITNASGWISLEGSDEEDLENLRDRLLNAWSELATNSTAAKYKSICEAVDGVLFVRVNDQHPRGQGTIDIVVTSSTGSATDALLALVSTAASKIKGPYDDVLVKSSTTTTLEIAVVVTIATGISTDGLADRVEATVRATMAISKDRPLNVLNHADLIYAVKRDVSVINNVKVTAPAADTILDTEHVIIPGTVTVTIVEE